MIEGSETPGGGLGPPDAPGGAPPREGRGRLGDSDLLAERRARRSVESGEQLLARRAEAAEATVRTLEAHVASLQRRLSEADQEHARASSPAEPERSGHAGDSAGELERPPEPAAGEQGTEQELRRARQREYAEQRERLEAEDRIADIERENGAEVERLRRRLSDSEGEAGMLAGRLQQLRRELAEAEQSLAAERAALRRAEDELRETVAQLEERAAAAERELESEREARERAERALERMHAGHVRLEALVEELKDAGARLRAAMARGPVQAPERAADAAEAGAGELDEAPQGAESRAELRPAPALRRAAAAPQSAEMVEALAAAVERLRARVGDGAAAEPPVRERAPRHRHSMSLIGRLRMARKQRRQR